jgi:4-hydroxybenzoate polyprenyltransferase
MSLKTTAAGLYKSTRAEIMVAFVVPVVMLGIACAVSTGLPLDWINLALGTGVIFSLVMMSNGLNNLFDAKIDAIAAERGNKKSGMYHLLADGGLSSRRAVVGVSVLSALVLIFLTVQLSQNTGKPVITFALFGLLMSVGYNLPPLMLAYRPFPELTMLLPSTIVAVVAMQYILVSQITAIAVCMGAAFGLFSATWFLWQSMIDYDVDMEAGKNTTPVYVGPLSAGIVGILYPAAGIMLLALSSGHVGLPLYTPAILGVVCMATMGVMMMFNAPNSFKIWKGTMWATFVFGVLSAVAIMLGRG